MMDDSLRENLMFDRASEAYASKLRAQEGLTGWLWLMSGTRPLLLFIIAVMMIGAFLLELRQFLQWLLARRKNKGDEVVMVSLPYSHYVELARWALFAKGVNVREIKCTCARPRLRSITTLSVPVWYR